MSKVFVKQPEDGGAFGDPPDRPVSQHPNFVTADGLARIELALARVQERWDAAEKAGDRAALGQLNRDLRYWVSRRATAQVVGAPADATRVHFGSMVVVARSDGGRQTCRIVGEDEADPTHGLLSYVSPLAQVLAGRIVGDVVQLDGFDIEILSIG